MFGKISKWSKHHKIETFGALSCFIILLLVIDCFTISAYSHGVEHDFLTNVAIYTPMFKTSLSDTDGTVTNVFVNEERTKCAIMLKIDSMMYKMSTDANDYRVFVKGWNVSKGQYMPVTFNHPTGGVYVFGSTGYMMIYIVDEMGWQNQALEFVVRCDTTLIDNSAGKDFAGVDVSYSQFDQFRFVVNPAAQSASVCKFFDGDNINITEIYQETILSGVENAQRETLKSDVVELNQYLSQIAAYKKALENLQVNVKPLPEIMAGDNVAFSNDEETGELRYYPTTIYPGGVDYNWYEGDLRTKSYLDEAIGDTGLTRPAFFDNLNKNHQFAPYMMPTDGWRRNNGTDINIHDYLASPVDENKQIASNINAYIAAVNGFCKLKHQYQTQDLVDYLYIQYNLEISGQAFTSNFKPDTIHVW